MEAQKPALYGLTLAQLREQLVERGLPKFSAQQVFSWLYKKQERNPESWTNVAKVLRQNAHDWFEIALPKVIWQGRSKDGTRKFLIGLPDGNSVETVAIPAKDRLTLCISSQVGCAIGCTFCHTGTMGLKRHLESWEIVGQFIAVQDWLSKNTEQEEKLTNIVYMGQGEPLHNFENVKTATEIFMEDFGLGLGQRRITLSTSGLVPQIEKLWDFPPVNIAISLHATRDDVRTELMPINKAYDLKRLFAAIKSIPLKAHRWITYEYILIAGLNDGPEDIEGLCDLLEKDVSKVNLIPFNEYPESNFKRPTQEQVLWFRDALMRRGYVCTIRTTKGDDILAACGQLKSMENQLNLWKSNNDQESCTSKISPALSLESQV